MLGMTKPNVTPATDGVQMTTEPTYDEVPAEPADLPREPAVPTGRHPDLIGRGLIDIADRLRGLDREVTDGGTAAQVREYWLARLELAEAEKALWTEMLEAMQDIGTARPPWHERAVEHAVAWATLHVGEAVVMVRKYEKHGAPAGRESYGDRAS